MNELLGIDPSIPIFHLVPFVVFGPIFFTILYHFGLKGILRPSPEARQHRRELKEQEARQKAEDQRKLIDAGLADVGIKRSPLQWLGQGLTYLLFAVVIGYFSSSPAYMSHPPDRGELRLSLSHAGRHKADCHKRSRAELQKLAANMRAPISCARERWPVTVRLDLDGKMAFKGTARPAGLSKDGNSSFYEKFSLTSGTHKVMVRLWDGDGKGDADQAFEKTITLEPAQVRVIGFNNEAGRLTLR